MNLFSALVGDMWDRSEPVNHRFHHYNLQYGHAQVDPVLMNILVVDVIRWGITAGYTNKIRAIERYTTILTSLPWILGENQNMAFKLIYFSSRCIYNLCISLGFSIFNVPQSSIL